MTETEAIFTPIVGEEGGEEVEAPQEPTAMEEETPGDATPAEGGETEEGSSSDSEEAAPQE